VPPGCTTPEDLATITRLWADNVLAALTDRELSLGRDQRVVPAKMEIPSAT